MVTVPEDQSDESKDTITILTQGIARLLDMKCPQYKVDQYIKHLRVLCYGRPDDTFSNCFGNRLSEDECLNCLLSIDDVLDYCLEHPSKAQMLAHQILHTPKLTGISHQFLSSLIPNLINYIPWNDILPTLSALWNHKDKSSFSITLVECMVLDRRKIEELFLKLYFETSEDDIIKTDSIECWVQWSSMSPFIFQTITTVLNNILIHSKNRLIILNIIEDYVLSVIKYCSLKNLNFVQLYPLDFQSLVILLRVEPSTIKFDPTFNDLVQFIDRSMKSHLRDPHISLMFLSHFPKWIPFFNLSYLSDI